MIMGLLEILLKTWCLIETLQGGLIYLLGRQDQVLIKIMEMVVFGTTLQGNGVMIIKMNNMLRYLVRNFYITKP